MKANWELTPLGLIAPANGNELPKRSETVWNLSLDDIEPETGRILKRTFCKVENLGSTKCCFDSRHVLYSKLRPYLNKVAMPDKSGVGTSELIPLLPDCSRLDREFLSLYLRSPYFLDFAKANTRGANLPRISMTELWKHQIPVPPLEEQRRIVARIKECMERVEEIERLRSEANAEREALAPALYEAIEKRSGWEYKSVGELVTRTRNGKSIRQVNEESTGFVLSLAAVHSVTLNIEAKKPIILPEAFAKTYAIRTGDIFVSRSNTRDLVGLSSVADESPYRIIFPDLLIQLTANSNIIIPRYLAYSLRARSARKQIQDRAVGTSQSMVKISAERLKEVKIPVPSLEEQRELVAALDEASENIRMMKSEADESKIPHLRDAILRKAFAGEL